MLLWGVMMARRLKLPPVHFRLTITSLQTVQGLVHNYGGLLGMSICLVLTFQTPTEITCWPGMRWMLGTFEAGLFPGGENQSYHTTQFGQIFAL
jgi:hypothetical protein